MRLTSRPLGPDINAAEMLSLSCQASGGTGVYSYQWSSSCMGGCFLSGRNVITPTITRDAARSADSGFYTCTVTDNAGNNGSDSTEIEVTGIFLFYFNNLPFKQSTNTGAGLYVNGIGNVLNNSILDINSGGRIPQLLCLSGSNMSVVGEWVGPDGTNLVAVQNDPFNIIFGESSNPGQFMVETPVTNPPITATHEGVYTCIIPDENDVSQYLHIGIYLTTSKLYHTHKL